MTLQASYPDPFAENGPVLYHNGSIFDGEQLLPVDALKAATANAAELLRFPTRGRLRKGLVADLLVANGDPTRDIAAAACRGNHRLVIKNGRAVTIRAVVGDARKTAHQHALVASGKPSIRKAPKHSGDETVGLDIAADGLGIDFKGPLQSRVTLAEGADPH